MIDLQQASPPAWPGLAGLMADVGAAVDADPLDLRRREVTDPAPLEPSPARLEP